ncbi:IS630 family transposase [Streptomyces sp. NBC_00868]|uniref:IS630 family transposase n=1 Tax=unclassified Streptomyces TaxID=2593676 RepID=UPI003243ED5A|nr:IS630 family transposase [Streptomyces sp. NBC_00868]
MTDISCAPRPRGLQAGARFEAGERTVVIARDLRVSERSVERWRRAWREGGEDAMRSSGPASAPKLSDDRFALLERELGRGPAAHGFEDRRWTLPRVQAVIGRRFRMRLSVGMVRRLLKRHGWSWQAPARRALERDEGAVELWKREVWPQVKAPRRRSGPGSSSRTRPDSRCRRRAPEPGAGADTHRVRVRGRSRRRISVAALCCYKPGEKSRMIYRPRFHIPLRGARRSFAWTDYRDLTVRAHLQRGGPIVLVWDILNTHLALGMKRYAAEHDWLTVFQLPPYAPDLNPVEGIWSLLRRGPMANTAFTDPDHLTRTLRRGLRHIQLRPALIDGCLTGTRLPITPPTPP